MRNTIISNQFLNEIIKYRKHLHTFPETAFEEYETSVFIKEKLESYGIEVFTGKPETAVIGSLKRSEKPFIGFRADMDGLNIAEKNNFSHKSKNQGKMHACGHDGHMAMLLGAAKYLAEDKEFNGNIYFIFQPAEENEGGARNMIENGFLNRFPMKAIFGMHNWPSLEENKVGIKKGPIMASCSRFSIILQGKGTHAAMPYKGNDLILHASELIVSLHSQTSRTNPFDNSVLSVTAIDSPDSWNILPEAVKLKGTFRCFSGKKHIEIETQIKKACKALAQRCNIKVDFIMHSDGYPITVNSPKETDFVINTAEPLLGKKNVVKDIEPSMGSEDFSFYLKSIPGCYFFLGSGKKNTGLHNPYYDFNDNILEIGVNLWITLAKNYFKKR